MFVLRMMTARFILANRAAEVDEGLTLELMLDQDSKAHSHTLRV